MRVRMFCVALGSKNIRIKIYKTMLLPVVLHGSVTSSTHHVGYCFHCILLCLCDCAVLVNLCIYAPVMVFLIGSELLRLHFNKVIIIIIIIIISNTTKCTTN
jgi:hypothetical protein